MVKNDFFDVPDISVTKIEWMYETQKTNNWQFVHKSYKEKTPENYYTFIFMPSGSHIQKFRNGFERIIKSNSLYLSCYARMPDYVNRSLELPHRYYSIAFYTDKPVSENFFIHGLSIVYPKNTAKIESLFAKALNIFLSKPITWEIDIKAIVLQVFSCFFNEHYHNDEKRVIPHDMLELKKTIDENIFDKDICISELAKNYYISHEHITRKFKKAFGLSPKQYIQNQRLQRAAALLAGTDKSISEICELTHFCDVSYLNKTFHKVYGMSPSQYRKENGINTY